MSFHFFAVTFIYIFDGNTNSMNRNYNCILFLILQILTIDTQLSNDVQILTKTLYLWRSR